MRSSIASDTTPAGARVFEQPRFIQNSFSVYVPDHSSAVDRQQDLYSRLKGRYFPPRLVNTSSPGVPESPALLFQSEHGHSQILVSAGNCTLNVTYSADWQTQPERARSYMTERTHLLFDIADEVSREPLLFAGSVTRVQMPSSVSDPELVAFIARVFAERLDDSDYHDLTLRTTTVVDDLFFSNLMIQNYRIWNASVPTPPVYRVSRHSAAERGLEIVSDYNSRYAFNEDKPFAVTREAADQMLDRNFDVVQMTLDRVRGGVQ
jgi:hypothetical protein